MFLAATLFNRVPCTSTADAEYSLAAGNMESRNQSVHYEICYESYKIVCKKRNGRLDFDF
jgi:hypothetical protein